MKNLWISRISRLGRGRIQTLTNLLLNIVHLKYNGNNSSVLTPIISYLNAMLMKYELLLSIQFHLWMLILERNFSVSTEHSEANYKRTVPYLLLWSNKNALFVSLGKLVVKLYWAEFVILSGWCWASILPTNKYRRELYWPLHIGLGKHFEWVNEFNAIFQFNKTFLNYTTNKKN